MVAPNAYLIRAPLRSLPPLRVAKPRRPTKHSRSSGSGRDTEEQSAVPSLQQHVGNTAMRQLLSGAAPLPVELALSLHQQVGNAAVAQLLRQGTSVPVQRQPANASTAGNDSAAARAGTEIWNVARVTFYVETGLVVLDLDDATKRSLQSVYNGGPDVGEYLDTLTPEGRLRPNRSIGGKPNDKGEVIEWVAPPHVDVRYDPSSLLTVSKGRPDRAPRPQIPRTPSPAKTQREPTTSCTSGSTAASA